MARPPKIKLNLRMPESLRDQAQELAEREGQSLNAFLLKAVENYLPFKQRIWDIADAKQRRLQAAQAVPKVGKKQRCPCGSGKTYGDCHGRKSAYSPD